MFKRVTAAVMAAIIAFLALPLETFAGTYYADLECSEEYQAMSKLAADWMLRNYQSADFILPVASKSSNNTSSYKFCLLPSYKKGTSTATFDHCVVNGYIKASETEMVYTTIEVAGALPNVDNVDYSGAKKNSEGVYVAPKIKYADHEYSFTYNLWGTGCDSRRFPESWGLYGAIGLISSGGGGEVSPLYTWTNDSTPEGYTRVFHAMHSWATVNADNKGAWNDSGKIATTDATAANKALQKDNELAVTALDVYTYVGYLHRKFHTDSSTWGSKTDFDKVNTYCTAHNSSGMCCDKRCPFLNTCIFINSDANCPDLAYLSYTPAASLYHNDRDVVTESASYRYALEYELYSIGMEVGGRNEDSSFSYVYNVLNPKSNTNIAQQTFQGDVYEGVIDRLDESSGGYTGLRSIIEISKDLAQNSWSTRTLIKQPPNKFSAPTSTDVTNAIKAWVYSNYFGKVLTVSGTLADVGANVQLKGQTEIILAVLQDLADVIMSTGYGESATRFMHEIQYGTYEALYNMVNMSSELKEAVKAVNNKWSNFFSDAQRKGYRVEFATIPNKNIKLFDLLRLPDLFKGESVSIDDIEKELESIGRSGDLGSIYTKELAVGNVAELDHLMEAILKQITVAYWPGEGLTHNVTLDYDMLFEAIFGEGTTVFDNMGNPTNYGLDASSKDTALFKYARRYKKKSDYIKALVTGISDYVEGKSLVTSETNTKRLNTWNQFVSVSKGVNRDSTINWSDSTTSAFGVTYHYYKEDGGSMMVSPNIVASEQLSRYEFQYNAAKDLARNATGVDGSLIEHAITLSIRADVLDYCATNNIEPTDFVIEVMSGTDNLINSTAQGRSTDGLFDYKFVYPMNNYRAGDYFYYQARLCYEAFVMSDLIFFGLLDVINGNVTMEDQQLYLDAIVAIKEVCDRYQNTYSHNIWDSDTGNTRGSYKEVTGYDLPEDIEDERYTQNDKVSLSDLYEDILALGLLSFDEYTVDIYDENNPMTLFWTSDGDASSATFSKEYLTGRALSATYIPMQTNLYDPYTMFDYVDTEWIENYQFKYGFHRKALYIDTNPDAAVDTYVSHTVGSTRLATLRDLFNCEQDIVLYIDDNFYNIKSLAEKQEKTYDRLSSADYHPSWLESFLNAMMWWKEVDFPVALKHAETNAYSNTIADNVNGMDYTDEIGEGGTPVWPADKLKRYDEYLLTGEQIRKYLTEPEYSDMMSFAFVSAIYRQGDLYNSIVDCVNQRPPVFVSSPTLATLQNADDDAKNTIYNYALLKNLPAMTTVGYENSTDMTSPIYVDIYGNIVTESGLVVVPAAANASLHTSRWQPICTGFLASYGKEWSIPANYNLDEEWMSGGFFTKNEEEGIWQIRNKRIQNTTVDFAALSYSDKTVNTAIRDWYSYDLVTTGQIDNTASLNVLHETMRGAPLENIDFAQENLNTGSSVTAAGLVSAAKLDSIINSLDWDDENSIMSVPNLSFIDNYQYVVVIVFKILLVIVVIAIMLTVYIDVLKAAISWKTLLRSVGILVIAVVSVLLIPVSYDIAYYQSNKYLLQDEAEYIMMLNTEKNMSGREIGIYSVAEPENNTKIYIKLENFEFNWLEVLPDVIFGDSITVLDERYKEFLANSLIANQPNVLAQNDGMYMDVQDIFNTSTINFNTSRHALYQRVSVDPVASYYIPYYYFLDALIKNMNDYNSKHSLYAYSTKIMRGGAVKTVNLCNAYFTSKEFMEDDSQDFLGLAQIYNSPGSIQLMPIFDEESAKLARSSQWVTVGMDEDGCAQRITLMTQKMREFVSKNRNLIGKVTDETFLKCMAMSLALDYNELFGIPSASALEIYNLSNADLMRLSIADKATTLEDSPMSFARFVYTEADTPGVYASVFLVIVTMFVQTMKTVITIAIMALLIISVFVFKILLRKPSHSIAGYLLTLLVICSTNVLYAIILKISLLVPQTGLAPTVCILLQIIVQLAYLFLLSIVLSFALRDWKNAGFTMYQTIGHNVKAKFQSMFDGHRQTSQERYDSKPRGVDGWDYYHKLVKENERRIKKVGNH